MRNSCVSRAMAALPLRRCITPAQRANLCPRSSRFDLATKARGDGSPLALLLAMTQSAEVVTDMATLARLHAALDSVTDTEQMIAQIHESSALSPPTVARVGKLVTEARELLHRLLVPPQTRHAVRMSNMRRDPDGW
jgi:hypothetical protein